MNNNLIPINQGVSYLNPLPIRDYSLTLQDWLNTKRSPHTRRVYQLDITNFLNDVGVSLAHFLSLNRFQAFELVSRYRGNMLTNGIKSATINRRLAAIKSLVGHGYQCGACEFTLETIKGEKLEAYRDTTGTSIDGIKGMLATCSRLTVKGSRDYALLMLLWGNALRCNEAAMTDINDFSAGNKTLRILGKGRGEHEYVSLGKGTVEAISQWLLMREGIKGASDNPALFIPVNPGYVHHRLSSTAIHRIVKEAGISAEVGKLMTPHKIRHSAITAALDATNGDVRKVQKLSRHKSLNTLMIYDDNRHNHQADVSDLLDGLV